MSIHALRYLCYIFIYCGVKIAKLQLLRAAPSYIERALGARTGLLSKKKIEEEEPQHVISFLILAQITAYASFPHLAI